MKSSTLRSKIFIPLFICVAGGLTIYNTVHLVAEIRERQKLPLAFSGLRFAGLNTVLKNETMIGYYTDRDTDAAENLAQFEQAQYTLAPLILDLNSVNHRFVLLDCTNDREATKIIERHDLRPLKKNNLGIILALNPKAAEP